MRYELFIARRLKLLNGNSEGAPSLMVAVAGMVLAIVVMILSITIVLGFKEEITGKIYHLDAHIKVTNAMVGLDDNYALVNGRDIVNTVIGDTTISSQVASMSLVAEQSAILKTEDDFMGIIYRGVDGGYDWDYITQHLVAGRAPTFGEATKNNEVAISQSVANKLRLCPGDRVMTYFIGDKVKVRRLAIVGIFNTDFDNFDDMVMMGNIAQIQEINNWNTDVGNYVALSLSSPQDIESVSYDIFSALARDTYDSGSNSLYNVSNTHIYNQAFFSWLNMLDMNVVVILTLMVIVACFTLISAMLMIVLDRVKTIGLLKAMGATNGSVRSIFIHMTQRLIGRALILGNAIGIGLALIQFWFHPVKLDAATYYMPYVPIQLNWLALVALNVGIIIITYASLLGPSYVVSRIRPTSTLRFE